MCGIFAILDKSGAGMAQPDINMLWHMGLISQHRGMDSSGMFSVPLNAKSGSRLIKRVGPFTDLPYEKNYDVFMKGVDKSQAIVGHCRWATIGKVTKQNAHPFKEEHITLVHNGTIKAGLTHQEADVDSHALTIEIKQKGFKEAFAGLDGAYAVIAHDEKAGCVYITRNIERPLYYIEDHLAIYILSTKEALTYLRDAHNLGYPNSEIKSFVPNRLYVFENGVLRDSEELIEKKSHWSEWEWGGQWKGYSPPLIGNSSTKSSTTKKTEQKYKIGDEIAFIVTGYSMRDNTVTYLGRDKEGTKIFFKTDKINPDWGDASGIGECCMVHSTIIGGEHTYQFQIKTRSIEWGDKEEDLIPLADDDPINKTTWRSLCRNEVCTTCRSPIAEDENEDTIVWEDQAGFHLVCGSCLMAGKADGYFQDQVTVEDVKRLMQ